MTTVHSQARVGEVTLVIEYGDLLGEVRLCNHRAGQLLWMGILSCVHAWNGSVQVSDLVRVDALIGSTALFGQSDLLLETSKGFLLWWEEAGEIDVWVNPIANKTVRFNDGRVDALGRFWVGTMVFNAKQYGEPLAELHRVDRRRGHAHGARPDVSNGVDWSPDERTKHLTDTMRRAIYAYDFDGDAGTISNRRTLIETAEVDGYPDGLVVHADGALWSAGFAGSGIFPYDSQGKRLRKIDMLVPRPIVVTFGGPGSTEAFMTTSRHAPPEDRSEIHAGALFPVDLGTCGRQAAIFGDGKDGLR